MSRRKNERLLCGISCSLSRITTSEPTRFQIRVFLVPVFINIRVRASVQRDRTRTYNVIIKLFNDVLKNTNTRCARRVRKLLLPNRSVYDFSYTRYYCCEREAIRRVIIAVIRTIINDERET